MDKIEAKQRRVIELLPYLSKCVAGRAVMVGGTALRLFYLNHRSSIDIDFAIEKEPDGFCKDIKGCLSKMGFEAKKTTYTNVFTVNFPETAVRIEVFVPSAKIKETISVDLEGTELKVASLPSLLELKLASYHDRRLFRDLFDIWAILRHEKLPMDRLKEVLLKSGPPVDEISELKMMNILDTDMAEFLEVMKHASA